MTKLRLKLENRRSEQYYYFSQLPHQATMLKPPILWDCSLEYLNTNIVNLA